MNEKWLGFIFYIVVSCGITIIVLLPKNREVLIKQNIVTIVLCFLWPIWSFIMIGGSIYHDIKDFKKFSYKEFPSYGKALAEITKKWDIADSSPVQFQAVRLMYDYLKGYYDNK